MSNPAQAIAECCLCSMFLGCCCASVFSSEDGDKRKKEIEELRQELAEVKKTMVYAPPAADEHPRPRRSPGTRSGRRGE